MVTEIITDDDKIIAEITPLLSRKLDRVYYIHNTCGLLSLTQNFEGNYIFTGWYMLGERLANRIKKEIGIIVLNQATLI